MVLSDPQGKAQERRRSSVSPSRDRDRRKPRRDWLVAVGQGHSPASTRSRRDDSRSSSPNKRSKKFDVDSLTFSGLEERQKQDLESVEPQSPSGGSSSPPSSPRLVNATQGREPGTPHTDDTTAGLLGSPCNSLLAFPILEQNSQELTAATAAEGEGGLEGATAAGGAGKGRDPLKPSLLLSPGKDYWAGRIAAGQTSPQGSESPRHGGTRRKKKRMGRSAVSPRRNGESGGDNGCGGGGITSTAAQLSPGSSTWSTQAFSPGVRLPASPASLGHGAGGRDLLSLSPRRARGRLGSSTSPGWSPARGTSSEAFSPTRPGSQAFSISSFRQGGPSLSPCASSVGSRAPPFGTSPGRDPLGSSFGRASQSVSPMRRQIARQVRSERQASPNRGAGPVAAGRVVSPSSLPSPMADSGRAESPERTTPQGHSPERTGVTSDDGIEGGLSSLRRNCGGLFGAGDNSSGGSKQDADTGTDGVELLTAAPAARPSPLKSQHCAVPTPPQRPSPSCGRGHGTTTGTEADPKCGALTGGGLTPSMESKPPLHENRVTPSTHAPPGVPTETVASVKRVPHGRETFSEEATYLGAGRAGREESAGAELRVSTPTGDGSASDLSLWVTIRRLEDAKEMGGFSSCSPSTLTPLTVLGTDLETGGGTVTGVTGAEFGVASGSDGGVGGRDGAGGAGVDELLPLLGGGGGAKVLGGSNGETAGSAGWREDVGGPGGEVAEAPWLAVLRALWGLLDFCRPCPGGDRGCS